MLKYVIIDNFKPIIFDVTFLHKDIAGNYNVTSAGFINNNICFGRSDSLDIDSKETDLRIIKNYFKLTFKEKK